MKIRNMSLWAPVTEAPAAGGGAAPSGPESVFGTPAAPSIETPTPASTPATPAAATPEPTPAAVPASTAQPAGVTMTEEQLASLAAKMAAGIAPQAPAAPQTPQQMTPEQQAQFDKEFNVVRVTPELFQSILGFAPENPAQLKAFENFAHGIVRQAAAMTMFQVQQMAKEREGALTQRLSPVLQHHQEQQAAKLETDFFTAHPDLKDFGGLVAEVAAAEKARGTTFKSPKEAIDYVANKARTLLGKGATPGGTTPSTTVTKPTVTKPSMPTVSTGGRSGSQSSPQPASGPKAVFGDLDGTR